VTTAGAGELLHLARRLAASLRGGHPSVADDGLARRNLDDAAWDLWCRQRPGDRRHAAAVARELARLAVPEPVPPWATAAALLHDIGKIETDLGVPGRVAAGVLKLVRIGRFPGRIGRYLAYPAAGAALLQRAGCDPRVVAWAAEHHGDPHTSTLPAPWPMRLAAADHRAV